MSFICFHGDEHKDNSRTLGTRCFHVSVRIGTETINFSETLASTNIDKISTKEIQIPITLIQTLKIIYTKRSKSYKQIHISTGKYIQMNISKEKFQYMDLVKETRS